MTVLNYIMLFTLGMLVTIIAAGALVLLGGWLFEAYQNSRPNPGLDGQQVARTAVLKSRRKTTRGRKKGSRR